MGIGKEAMLFVKLTNTCLFATSSVLCCVVVAVSWDAQGSELKLHDKVVFFFNPPSAANWRQQTAFAETLGGVVRETSVLQVVGFSATHPGALLLKPQVRKKRSPS
jgi:hypothetical protein